MLNRTKIFVRNLQLRKEKDVTEMNALSERETSRLDFNFLNKTNPVERIN